MLLYMENYNVRRRSLVTLYTSGNDVNLISKQLAEDQ